MNLIDIDADFFNLKLLFANRRIAWSTAAYFLLPLMFLAILGYDMSNIIWLYWFESIVIGIFTVIRIMLRKYPHPIEMLKTAYSAIGFLFHYGAFITLFGMFLGVYVFSGVHPANNHPGFLSNIVDILTKQGLWAPLIVLVSYHLIDWLCYVHKYGSDYDGIKYVVLSPYRRFLIFFLTVAVAGTGIICLGFIGALIFTIFRIWTELYYIYRKDKYAVSEGEFLIDEELRKKYEEFASGTARFSSSIAYEISDIDELKKMPRYDEYRSELIVRYGRHKVAAAAAEAYAGKILKKKFETRSRNV